MVTEASMGRLRGPQGELAIRGPGLSLSPQAGRGRRGAAPHAARQPAHANSGDHAGSDAKLGVGTLSSLRPVISMVWSAGPVLPPESRKNIRTRPLGAKVGPSLWKPSVRMRSPLPSTPMTPIAKLPWPCLVNALRSPRGDHTGVE